MDATTHPGRHLKRWVAYLQSHSPHSRKIDAKLALAFSVLLVGGGVSLQRNPTDRAARVA